MRMKSKQIEKKQKTTKKYWILAGIIASFLLFGTAIKQIFYPPVFPVLHGPHLSVALYNSGLNEKDVLGSKTNRFTDRFRRKPTPTPIKIVKPSPSPTPKPTPTPVPIIPTKHNMYGIAAGGVLPFYTQAELDTYFSQLKNLGVTWVRYDFEWGVIQENGPGSFDWTGTDRVVQTASKYAIKTLGTIAYAPYWARLSSCKDEFACSPADPNAFGTFAGQVAVHYSPLGVHHWEIWNEPNITIFWKPAPSINSYVTILKSAYTQIKKADPSSVVLTAGLSPAGDENSNIAPITFIQALYELDPAKNFDGIALHTYSYPVVASYPASWNAWQQMSTIRQLMTSHSDNNKQLWITEYGAPTGGSGIAHTTTQLSFTFGSDYMSEDAQSLMMQDALSEYSKITTPVGPFFIYSLRDINTSQDTPENFFGLMRYDWSKKPAYDVLHNAIVAGQ
jgi:polysaccharide biosynthesis protein PslG